MASVRDVAVIGGGIVGLSVALNLVERFGVSVVVLETEKDLAQHQTGHNSGVIHSGLYYRPGSYRARNCTEGRELMYRFCEDHGIPHERCGKVVVATDPRELPNLDELERKGQANGLAGMKRIGPEEIKEHEPHVAGIAGLWIPETGIVDYKEVCRKYAELAKGLGAEIRLEAQVTKVSRDAAELVLETKAGPFRAKHLVNCGGLQSDRVARMCGVDPGVQIVPFRGEYYEIVPERRHLVKGLIYPVPDPAFPFLGVHFTKTVHGDREAGPNAVLALCREGYSWSKISLRDIGQMLGYRGFWAMARKHWKTGFGEMHRSLSKRAFHKALSRLMPELRMEDIRPFGAGVRAQALDRDGKLVDDFRFVEADRMIHVLNAPSPAATASIAIGRTIADMAGRNFTLPARRAAPALSA
ncbi:MAG: L-2-hydroxyglutarate oxidase [Gemmataceae bacterium]